MLDEVNFEDIYAPDRNRSGMRPPRMPTRAGFLGREENFVPVNAGDLSEEDRECSIYKVPYNEADGEGQDAVPAEQPVRLACPDQHVFGEACIRSWLDEHTSCPMCRRELFGRSWQAYEMGDIGEMGEVK